MAPIRLGIIGLSASAKTSWASTAHLPYLLSARGRTKYTIVALCNSTVASARAAIGTYGLDPAATRAYGDPAALAADPDVDLVLACTRVDTHDALIRPSIEAGKDVYVEWPLTHDIEHSRALAALAGAKGVRTIVGFQGQRTPLVLKIRELVRGGSLGKVLSSEVRAYGGTVDRETIKDSLSYFADRKIGGNIYTIGFGHRKFPLSRNLSLEKKKKRSSSVLLETDGKSVFDYVQLVLGEATDLQPRFQIQRPEMKLKDSTGNIIETVTSNVPDLTIVTGSIIESSAVRKGATLHARYRRGQPFKGEPGFTWHIYCEQGEIRLVSPTGSSLHADAYSGEPITLDVHDYATDEVRSVDWEWPKWQEENDIPYVARSVADMYEIFYAEAVEGAPREYPNFSDALKRHEQLDSLLSGWKAE